MEFSRTDLYRWRYEASLEHKIILALAFASFTGLCAQLRIYLPWTPVPVTMQTFAVFLSAILLGRNWGGISQLLYVFLGTCGVPWFAGLNGGISVLFGPTGGYLLGFIIAALFIGYFIDRYIASRFFVTLFPLLLFANFVIIHGLGCIWLFTWLTATGKGVTVFDVLLMGSLPFIPGDVAKILAISVIGRFLTPKIAYNGEIDAGRKYRLL